MISPPPLMIYPKRKRTLSLTPKKTAFSTHLVSGYSRSLKMELRKYLLWLLFLCFWLSRGNAYPNIQVTGDDWGQVAKSEVHQVLVLASQQILPHTGREQWPALQIRNTADGPMTLYQRGEEGQYVILLNTRDRRWCQYVFQFAHELGHIVCGFKKKGSHHRWLEESISEVASLFVLQKMSTAWKEHPPLPDQSSYFEEFPRYLKSRINRVPKMDPFPFKQWWQKNRNALEMDSTLRLKNLTIAKQLLPLFEKDPDVAWSACGYLNTFDQAEKPSFERFLRDWSDSCTKQEHKLFVHKLRRCFFP